MPQRSRAFHILDKDLGRVTNAERAGLQSGRPVVRLGIAALFIAVAALLSLSAFAGHPALGIVLAGVAISAYLAMSIGANDVANSLGPAVGAGAIGMTTGLMLVAVMQIAGAGFAGSAVTGRLADGIVMTNFGGETTARMMLAALLAAATWISLATWADAPVSTTHSIVGAIMGAGVAVHGWDSIDWNSMAMITLGWLLSPLIAGVLAAALMQLFRSLIFDQKDRLDAARRWLPSLIAAMVALFALNVCILVFTLSLPLSLVIAALAALPAGLHARHVIGVQIRAHVESRAAFKAIFGLPLVMAALMMGFAHGANDAANVTAPLSAVLMAADGPVERIALWAPLLAGLGIAAGALLFGRRLVHMVGSRITRLNANRAFCVSLATALTVIAASGVGLPVSTTHVAVGGVFGIGFYREWLDRRNARERTPLPDEEHSRRYLVRRSYMRTIFGAWLITVPAAALLGAICATLIGR